MYTNHDLPTLRSLAAEQGCELIIAKPNELLIDDDKGTAMPAGILALIEEKFGVEDIESWTSRRGGKHWKVRLTVDVEPEIAIVLQAALGSDPMRETLAAWERHALRPLGNPDTRSLFRPLRTVAVLLLAVVASACYPWGPSSSSTKRSGSYIASCGSRTATFGYDAQGHMYIVGCY